MEPQPYTLVVIESVAKPGKYLRFYALAHEGDKRWGSLAEADRFIETEHNKSVHGLATRRGLKEGEYKIVALPAS